MEPDLKMGTILAILQSVGTTPDERDKLIINVKGFAMTPAASLKARLHGRFLSRQLDAIFVALKLHQVSNMFESPVISRRQIVLKIAPGLHVRF